MNLLQIDASPREFPRGVGGQAPLVATHNPREAPQGNPLISPAGHLPSLLGTKIKKNIENESKMIEFERNWPENTENTAKKV